MGTLRHGQAPRPCFLSLSFLICETGPATPDLWVLQVGPGSHQNHLCTGAPSGPLGPVFSLCSVRTMAKLSWSKRLSPWSQVLEPDLCVPGRISSPWWLRIRLMSQPQCALGWGEDSPRPCHFTQGGPFIRFGCRTGKFPGTWESEGPPPACFLGGAAPCGGRRGAQGEHKSPEGSLSPLLVPLALARPCSWGTASPLD